MNSDEWNKIDEMVLSNDLLGRASEMRYLTKYLVSISEEDVKDHSFVLNINSSWGFGKSFLLKGWQDNLKSLGYPSAYFDAWKTDFSNEPLLSFVSEISRQLQEHVDDSRNEFSKKLDSIKTNAVKIKKNMTPFLLNILARKATGFTMDALLEQMEDESPVEQVESGEENSDNEFSEQAVDVLHKTLNKLADIATRSELRDYSLRKDSIANFESSFGSLIGYMFESLGWKKPFFVFVDELDRCRPTYAIELLETIKHLFNIKSVVFVIATDSEQLGHSIKAVYGEGFDSNSYLKRFFDVEYRLGVPDRLELSNFLIKKLPDDARINLYIPFLGSYEDHSSMLAQYFANAAECFDLGIRDQLKIFEIVKSVIMVSGNNKEVHFIYLLVLSILYYKYESYFQMFERGGGSPSANRMVKELFNDGDLSRKSCGSYDIPTSNSMGLKTIHYSVVDLFVFYAKANKASLEQMRAKDFSSGPYEGQIEKRFVEFLTGRYGGADQDNRLLSGYPRLVAQAGNFE